MIFTRTEVKRMVAEAFEILIRVEEAYSETNPEFIATALREALKEWVANPVDSILDNQEAEGIKSLASRRRKA